MRMHACSARGAPRLHGRGGRPQLHHRGAQPVSECPAGWPTAPGAAGRALRRSAPALDLRLPGLARCPRSGRVATCRACWRRAPRLPRSARTPGGGGARGPAISCATAREIGRWRVAAPVRLFGQASAPRGIRLEIPPKGARFSAPGSSTRAIGGVLAVPHELRRAPFSQSRASMATPDPVQLALTSSALSPPSAPCLPRRCTTSSRNPGPALLPRAAEGIRR